MIIYFNYKADVTKRHEARKEQDKSADILGKLQYRKVLTSLKAKT